MASETQSARQEMLQHVAELAGVLGLNRSVGLLYGVLYMSPEPMSLDQLAEAGSMSKANASLNMRHLESWGAARKIWVPGDRKDYYEAVRDVPGIVARRMRDGLAPRLEALGDTLERAAAEGDDDPDAWDRERLAEIRRYLRVLRWMVTHSERLYGFARRFL
jgi:DNA-binding transcriptional regulator GbsR (MarR family)